MHKDNVYQAVLCDLSLTPLSTFSGSWIFLPCPRNRSASPCTSVYTEFSSGCVLGTSCYPIGLWLIENSYWDPDSGYLRIICSWHIIGSHLAFLQTSCNLLVSANSRPYVSCVLPWTETRAFTRTFAQEVRMRKAHTDGSRWPKTISKTITNLHVACATRTNRAPRAPPLFDDVGDESLLWSKRKQR